MGEGELLLLVDIRARTKKGCVALPRLRFFLILDLLCRCLVVVQGRRQDFGAADGTGRDLRPSNRVRHVFLHAQQPQPVPALQPHTRRALQILKAHGTRATLRLLVLCAAAAAAVAPGRFLHTTAQQRRRFAGRASLRHRHLAAVLGLLAFALERSLVSLVQTLQQHVVLLAQLLYVCVLQLVCLRQRRRALPHAGTHDPDEKARQEQQHDRDTAGPPREEGCEVRPRHHRWVHAAVVQGVDAAVSWRIGTGLFRLKQTARRKHEQRVWTLPARTGTIFRHHVLHAVTALGQILFVIVPQRGDVQHHVQRSPSLNERVKAARDARVLVHRVVHRHRARRHSCAAAAPVRGTVGTQARLVRHLARARRLRPGAVGNPGLRSKHSKGHATARPKVGRHVWALARRDGRRVCVGVCGRKLTRTKEQSPSVAKRPKLPTNEVQIL
eukprot:Rhum_TRINITY_DN12253_c1_g10::Rhum_TRINITY_DN12253_c1_g10_i1::g.50561::m.50561